MRTITKIPTLVLLCCILWASSNRAMAQDKIAYVSAEDVIKLMPEYKSVQNQLVSFQAQLVKQLDEEKRAIAKYYTEVIEDVKKGALSPKQQQDAEAELQKRQAGLEKKTAEADQNLLAKEQSLTKPIYEKFDAALKTVAKANGYTYILDKKLLMYSTGGIDATDKLKKEVGAN